MSRTQDATKLENVRKELRSKGLRCTAARIAVMRKMLEAKSPQTHAEVAESLSAAGFDRATVYRNLVELADAQLLNRIELGDHVWRFELRIEGAEGDGDHPHFVCTECGKISCLNDVQVKISPQPGAAKSAMASILAVLLKGRCRKCG